MNKTPAVIAVALLAAFGVWYYLTPAPRPRPPLPTVKAEGVTTPGKMPTSEKAGERVIYTVSSAADADDDGLAPQKVKLEKSDTPARDSLNALCLASHSPLPKGTTLRGLKLEDGLATADFSGEFRENFHGGSTEEARTLNSILLTLGQFPAINRVQILVDGKKIDALSNLEIDGPLDVMHPDATKTAHGGGA